MNKKGFLFSFLALALITGLSVGCRIKKAIPNENVQAKDQIIFLNFKASKNTEGTYLVELLNKIIVEGRLKSEEKQGNEYSNDVFLCIFLNEKKEKLSSIPIVNPLTRAMEVVDENGQFSIEKVDLDVVEFSLRVQLPYNTQFIKLIKISDDNKILTLINIEL